MRCLPDIIWLPPQLADGSGHTALHLAVRYEVLAAVPLLASYGADLHAEDSCGMTALHMASCTLQEDIVSSLIRLGAHVNAVRFISFKLEVLRI